MIKKLTILLYLSWINIGAFSQKKLNLILKYDTEFKRYEVCVKPTFSEKNFVWGPSQISVVVPSKVLVEKIRVTNVDGGTWDDTSIIISPEITPEKSFHGISSSGDKTNLVENHEAVLFYFTLPEAINPNDVRIYDNTSDPKSDSKGMMGGDFRNSIVDITGLERFESVILADKVAFTTEKSNITFDVSVYPNVISNRRFGVKFNENNIDSPVLMIISDNSGREVFRIKSSKRNLEKQSFELPINNGSVGLVAKFISSDGIVSKRLLIEE